MELCLIWAQARNRAIGRDGTLPWHSPEDLRHFKALTAGCPVVMGRKTWDSLPFKPLPGRRNLVVSRTPGLKLEGAEVHGSLPAALGAAFDPSMARVFVIGGQALYESAIEWAKRLFVTRVLVDVPQADAFAPEIDEGEFELVAQSQQSQTEPKLVFEEYARRHRA